MKKWISLCLALTLASNTALFGAEEVKKETPRSSLLAYAKPIAKIALGVGGAAVFVLVTHIPTKLLNIYKGNQTEDRDIGILSHSVPIALCIYVTRQGIQELVEQIRTPKEIETELVTQEEPQI